MKSLKIVTKRLPFIVLFLLAIETASLGQDKLKFEQLSAPKQTSLKQIAGKYRAGLVNYGDVRVAIVNAALTNSDLSIEYLVEMVFRLMADDERKKTKELLDQMNEIIRRKEALRQGEELIRKEIDSLNNILRSRYHNHSQEITGELAKKQIKLDQYQSQEKELVAAANKNEAARMEAEKHRQSVEAAISKQQKIQSGKKQQ